MQKFILITCALLVAYTCIGQENYEPSPLVEYNKTLRTLLDQSLAEQRELVKTLPKRERKLANDYVKDRSKMLTTMMTNGSFIFDTPLNTYLEGVFGRILKANPEINPNTSLLLSRSGSINAFTTGDGFFVLNLGLISEMKTESELAFVIGHELGHQTFDHVNKTMLARAQREADPERTKELKRILREEYRVSSKLTDFVLPGMVASREFNRALELEADSLGYLYAKRSGFSDYGSIGALTILDSVDASLYGRKIPWKQLYASNECHADPVWKEITTGSSLGSFNTVDEDLVEKLKTHPDCGIRIAQLKDAHAIEQTIDTNTTYEKFRTIARMELIESYRIAENLGAALYHSIQLQLDYPENKFALENSANALGLIALLKKQRRLGEYVSGYSIYEPKDYGRFLQVLWETSATECSCLAYKFNKSVKNPYSPERHLAVRAIAAYCNGDLDEMHSAAYKYYHEYPEGKQIIEILHLLKIQYKTR